MAPKAAQQQEAPAEPAKNETPAPEPLRVNEIVAQVEGAVLAKHLQAFRKFEAIGTGHIPSGSLHAALEFALGAPLSARDFNAFLAETEQKHGDEEEDTNINFAEFLNKSKLLSQLISRSKARVQRNYRAYFTPEQVEHYTGVFKSRAGDDGRLDATELQEFLAKYNVHVAMDRVKTVMAEIDEDKSGYLDVNEFLVLLVKAMGLKKRKDAGPGISSLTELAQEGWGISDLKKAGYDCNDFLQARYEVAELMDVFTPGELRRAGVKLTKLMEHGWNCMRAREFGFDCSELIRAGCTVEKVRAAGWNDIESALHLRKLGVDAGRLRHAGWTLSELRTAGYSAAHLRLAGYSHQAVICLDEAMAIKRGSNPKERRSTCELRKEVELKFNLDSSCCDSAEPSMKRQVTATSEADFSRQLSNP